MVITSACFRGQIHFISRIKTRQSNKPASVCLVEIKAEQTCLNASKVNFYELDFVSLLLYIKERWASRPNLTPSELPEATEHETADGSLHATDHVSASMMSVMLFPGSILLCQPHVSSVLMRTETSERNMIYRRDGEL